MLHRRPAAVAGTFYPSNRMELERSVARLLAPFSAPGSALPKAIVVPHAGYMYSGSVAASAFAQLAAHATRIGRVILLGPTHRVALTGLAVPSVACFETPLGEVALDRAGIRAVARLPQVAISDRVHQDEHALEVQLPFLQRVLNTFTVLPLAVGDASPQAVAEVLEMVWGGAETVIVVSTDLSHFLPRDAARRIDAVTLRRILALESSLTHEQACGATPVNGFLLAAKRHGLHPSVLAACNSGDTAGTDERVVGYAALTFRAPVPDPVAADAAPPPARAPARAPAVLPGPSGPEVLEWARRAIESALARDPAAPAGLADAPAGASFVTLTRDGALRGCVGTLDAHRPLAVDVWENARAAAFHDPRFAPISAGEWSGMRIEVSVLSAPEPIDFVSEADARAQLRPGIDGVVLSWGTRRSTFLPQVWTELPEPADFLDQLKRKAGLAREFWSDALQLSRYTVQKWREPAS